MEKIKNKGILGEIIIYYKHLTWVLKTYNIYIYIYVVLSSADSYRNTHIYAGYIPTQWTTDTW